MIEFLKWDYDDFFVSLYIEDTPTGVYWINIPVDKVEGLVSFTELDKIALITVSGKTYVSSNDIVKKHDDINLIDQFMLPLEDIIREKTLKL